MTHQPAQGPQAVESGKIATAMRALTCLYIAVESDVADDVNRKVRAAFDELNASLQAETARREQAEHSLHELLHGGFSEMCAYCGVIFPPPDGWEALRAHIRICQYHPARLAIEEEAERREQAEQERDKYRDWFRASTLTALTAQIETTTARLKSVQGCANRKKCIPCDNQIALVLQELASLRPLPDPTETK